VEDGVTLEAPTVQPEAVVQPEVATPIATIMERPRRQQRQPVDLQDCEVNLDDEVDDNGDLVHFAFLAESEPVRLADVIQHPKWQEVMNEEFMAIEKNNTWQLTDLPKGHKAIDFGLFYFSSKKIEILEYSDSDWGGDPNERKSTSGNCFMIENTACLWSSKKQSIVALSTCEAEYVAAAASTCQSVRFRNIMTQIGFNLDVPIKIYVDNVSAINLAKNVVFHQKTKHIDIRYHFLRDQVGKNMIKLEYCRSEYHIADIFTTALKIDAFIKLRDLLGMKVVPNQN